MINIISFLSCHFSEENVNLIHSKKSELNCELVGSWTVEVGDLDQALHLWQYTGGYERVDHAQAVLSKDEVRNVLPNDIQICQRHNSDH